MAENQSLLRILVSTDNHLGVYEKEEDRKHDSFATFEEILQLAQEHDVDLLLLGGDLFHDNKPSRTTINRTIELMNKYCLGDRPVQIRVLNSNQAEIFVAGCVNTDNPNINIGLPVFTIHGNHDDPSGADNLSAVDLLSTCGLVNYFGKVLLGGNNIGTIKLQPMLIEKGSTKLAVYGLGNVRDERLGRLFQTPGAVQWLRPASTPEIHQDDWLNVFVLHQNRVQHGPNAKNCLQERHLPDFLDLVIWGHEHECVPSVQDLQKPAGAADRAVQVLQPGSSVATALSEGEARPKHAFLLECLEDKWRTSQLPLHSVRPFMWDTITLGAVAPPLDPEDTEALTAVLERKVNAMIQQANRSNPTPPAAAAAAAAAGGCTAPAPAANNTQQQQAQQQVLPLIRLRVDYTGFGTINSQRFGQKYVGKVANPHDMLLWAKAAARRVKDEARAADEAEVAAGLGLSIFRPEALDQARIEDLVAANLQAKLDILHPDDLAQALHQFVEKEEKTAIAECVTRVLQQTQVQVLSRPGAAGGTQSVEGGDEAAGGGADAGDGADGGAAPVREEDIADVINLCVQQRAASKQAGATQEQHTTGIGSINAAAAAAGGARVSTQQADPELLGGDDSDENPAAGGGGRARGRGRGGKSKGAMPPPAPKGRQRKGAAAAAAAAGADGMRQSGLMEAFARGGSAQQTAGGAGAAAGVGSPQGRTGSNLNGYLTGASGGTQAAGGAGGGTPSQATSRSRSAAGSAARGRGARGGRAGGRGRGRKAAAAESEELVDSDDDDGGHSSGGEGISDSDSEPPPAKKARGTTSRPTRSAAKPVNYADGGDEGGGGGGDGGLISSDHDDAHQQQRQQQATQQTAGGGGGRGGGRRTAAAKAAAAAAESISDDDDDDVSLSLSEPIEDSEEEEGGAGRGSTKKRGRGSQKGAAGGGGSARGKKQPPAKRQKTTPKGGARAQQGMQETGGGGGRVGSVVLGPNSIDGGYVDSDSDGGDAGGGRARPAPSAAGGRRRVLPSSLAS